MTQATRIPRLIRLLGTQRRMIFFLLLLVASGFHAVLLLLPDGLAHRELNTLEGLYARRAMVEEFLGRRFEKTEDIAIVGFTHSFSPEKYRDVLAIEPALALMAEAKGTEYNRALYAKILERLMAAGARLVVFDFFFDQRQTAGMSPGEAARQAEGNREFAAALVRWHDRVVLGSHIRFESRMVSVEEPEEILLPEDEAQADALLGFVNVWPDAHGCISRSVLAENTLALSNPALLGNRRMTPDIFSLASRAAMKLGKPAPQTTAGVLINYAGPAGTFPVVPVQDIFVPTEWRNRYGAGAWFKDKIVIVGPYSEIHYKDGFRTPVGAMLGAEIQASCLNNALRDGWLAAVFPGCWAAVWTLLLGGALWLVFTAPVMRRTGAVRMLLVAVVFVGVVYIMYWVAFVTGGVVFPGFSLTLAMLLAVAYIALDFIRSHYERMRIRNLFGTYLSETVVQRMVEMGEEPKLGGEQVELTGFFSDIQGFSSFSEQLQPGQLVELMNDYLGVMTRLLERHEGTLDKYIGDAMVAMFGAPLAMPDHAARACACALDMQAALAELRKQWSHEPGKWPAAVSSMRMRIGLHTGPAVVGNMGSSRRFSYTMMGDTVNLAARCESGAKAAGVFILITEAVVDAATRHDDTLVFRALDRWRVKGRNTPVTIYELVTRKGDLNETTARCLELYARGLESYWQRDWAKARGLFLEAERHEPWRPERDNGVTANPSLVMAARCMEYLVNPPSPDWDGVYAMTGK